MSKCFMKDLTNNNNKTRVYCPHCLKSFFLIEQYNNTCICGKDYDPNKSGFIMKEVIEPEAEKLDEISKMDDDIEEETNMEFKELDSLDIE